jgi:hypothetical protein
VDVVGPQQPECRPGVGLGPGHRASPQARHRPELENESRCRDRGPQARVGERLIDARLGEIERVRGQHAYEK